MTEESGTLHTRDKILYAAVRLFSERGYKKVTMRDIGWAVGVKAPSIYNYFASKKDLLTSIYSFYAQNWKQVAPDIDALMPLVETIASPLELLPELFFRYPPGLEEVMDSIIVFAAREINTDSDSERFIREYMFSSTDRLVRPLLLRMAELGKIEPLDIDNFIRVIVYFNFGASALHCSPLKLSSEGWSACTGLLFGMVQPKGE